ncbi:hypothetical protein SJ940_13415 [Enterococcus faecium]|uniref:hypothetical protein n=1 Tax=Enterococcus TaxID=1350 RepID=UPI000AEC309E|nr:MULTISPECIES: hypothetical protein [Enterococcus]MCZ1690081.1 hypothetical protein [Enterococcus faecium]
MIDTLQKLAYQSVQIVNIHEGWLTKLAREVGQQLGLTFSVWTVNELETIEYLARCGVYNITSRCAWAYLWKKGAQNKLFYNQNRGVKRFGDGIHDHMGALFLA